MKIGKANKLFKDGKYEQAIAEYKNILITHPELSDFIAFNINLATLKMNSNEVINTEGIKEDVVLVKDAAALNDKSKIVLNDNWEGHIDYLNRFEAKGWVWNPLCPEDELRVEAVLNGEVIGSVTANEYRDDLFKYGKGTGLYGFHLKFHDQVLGNTAPEFKAIKPEGFKLNNEIALPPLSGIKFTKKRTGSFSELYEAHAKFTAPGEFFEEYKEDIINPDIISQAEIKPLLIAFYLPQFHPIDENDNFWGKGFTEWRQLFKSVSKFPGHYQPRVPRDLGFYDLNQLNAFRKQVEMALKSGIGGFAYYYYWFNKKRVLEKPIELMLNSDVDMPFILIWANENWTRTWDGAESEVLLKQDYRQEDDDALVADWVRHFNDRRYIKLNQRPFFVIYNPKNIPDAKNTIERWRRMISKKIRTEPLIFMAQTFGELDPSKYGLDGALEFPPHKLSQNLQGREMPDSYSPDFKGRVIEYDDFVDVSLKEPLNVGYPLVKTIVPSWDNDCRRPNRGLTLESSTPLKYQKWLEELINRAIRNPIEGTPIVAINAWNEWAEGAYLEPDVYYGSAYLNSTARAYRNSIQKKTVNFNYDSYKVSVIFPNFNHSRFLNERINSVLCQTIKPAEIIFLDDCSTDDSVQVAKKILSESGVKYQIIENEKNSGCVFKQWIKGIDLCSNELIWIAETDDFVDSEFLENLILSFARDDVLVAFGKITCVDIDGKLLPDLDRYYDDLDNFSWLYPATVPAYKAFSRDFALKNVIPNASGVLFRKPHFTEHQKERLYEYKFAGDWYFYALIARGGMISYVPNAKSYFRVNKNSASRSAFYTDKHLSEHIMVIEDIRAEYAISDAVVSEHVSTLATFFKDLSIDQISSKFVRPIGIKPSEKYRICIVANGFSVGGGEILPVDLANKLKENGLHITYLVIENRDETSVNFVRKRLRSDIPVVYWDDVSDNFDSFIKDFGIQVINSHNISFDYRAYLQRLNINIPYIASLHGGYETVPDLITPDFLSYINNVVDYWFYLSQKNLLPILPIPDNKLVHSYNGCPAYNGLWVDRTEFRDVHKIKHDAFVIVQCSRAIANKGWEVSINSVQKIYDTNNKNIHLVLIGDGPIFADLKRKYAASNFVTFLGQVENPIRYFKCFDMAIFPSTYEGETFPLFLLEAFQAGLPAISTNIGEIPRMMVNEDLDSPGILIDFTLSTIDLINSFSEGILKIFNSHDLYVKYSRAAVQTSSRFSLDNLCALYIRYFSDVLDVKPKNN